MHNEQSCRALSPHLQMYLTLLWMRAYRANVDALEYDTTKG